ncbi:hypothetical protein VTK56DRAFT_1470 [Thermocarpiscus australiensis]
MELGFTQYSTCYRRRREDRRCSKYSLLADPIFLKVQCSAGTFEAATRELLPNDPTAHPLHLQLHRTRIIPFSFHADGPRRHSSAKSGLACRMGLETPASGRLIRVGTGTGACLPLLSEPSSGPPLSQIRWCDSRLFCPVHSWNF